MLYNLAMLQLYNEDPDAPGILEDLNAYQHNLRHGRSKTHDTEQADSIVEILLSFASKPSRFCHQMGLQLLKAFASNLSREGIHSLIRVHQSPYLYSLYSYIIGSRGERKLPGNTRSL